MSHSEKEIGCCMADPAEMEQHCKLDTKQLFKALTTNKTTRPFFDGIYAKDLLENIESPPQLIICNTDVSFEKGEHWVAFFFQNEICEFYDSMNKPLNFYGPEFVDFVKKFSVKCITTKKRTQPVNSSLCGLYCLFFAFHKCAGKSLSAIVKKMISKKNVVTFVKKMFKICKKSESKFLMSCITCK